MNSKQAKQAAKRLNAHHMKTCAGFYGSNGGRFFQARENNGALEVSPDHGTTWTAAPAAFHDHNGRALTV